MHQLPLMEQFYTLQGEGFHQGRAAYFVRLGGCDVGCVWCDVKESWDAAKHPLTEIDLIIQAIQKTPAEIVVVTGGEPLMYNCAPLTKALHAAGYKTHLETSGAYPLTGNWDWICFSPKKFKAPLPEVAMAAHELKVVIFNKSDFEWAEKNRALVNGECKLFLQPEWSAREKILPLLIDYIKLHPEWELSMQLHKYIDVP